MSDKMYTIAEYTALKNMHKLAEKVGAVKTPIVDKKELDRLNKKLPMKDN